MTNIEVEIRGKLDKESYDKLEDFLKKEGSFVESHEREMILLHGYPGFSENPLERVVDIRLRKTNGDCEIMVKRMLSEDITGRSEMSLKPADNDWDKLKEICKAFGVTKGTLIHRAKEVYTYNGIEWSLVTAPQNIYYYEAEMLSLEGKTVEENKDILIAEAKKLNLEVFDNQETKKFIDMLNERVNTVIQL